MKVTITSVGGRVPPVRKRGGLPQKFVRTLQVDHFALQSFQLGALVGRQAGAAAGVSFGLPHPLAQRLTCAPDLARDRFDRRPLRGMFGSVLPYHPHRSFADLWRISGWSCHGAILSRNEPSDKPGTVHNAASLAIRYSRFGAIGRCFVCRTDALARSVSSHGQGEVGARASAPAQREKRKIEGVVALRRPRAGAVRARSERFAVPLHLRGDNRGLERRDVHLMQSSSRRPSYEDLRPTIVHALAEQLMAWAWIFARGVVTQRCRHRRVSRRRQHERHTITRHNGSVRQRRDFDQRLHARTGIGTRARRNAAVKMMNDRGPGHADVRAARHALVSSLHDPVDHIASLVDDRSAHRIRLSAGDAAATRRPADPQTGAEADSSHTKETQSTGIGRSTRPAWCWCARRRCWAWRCC